MKCTYRGQPEVGELGELRCPECKSRQHLLGNKGYNHQKELADRSEADWIFGGLSQPSLVTIPLASREHWLPQGELQNIGEEKSWCASASPSNHLEALFSYYYSLWMHPDNKKWLEENGYVVNGRVIFSDAFIAINSGTTREGNSLKAPLEAIRKNGLIPKALLPQLPGWDETMNPARITQKMKDLGLEFARRFTINYERVEEQHIAECLKDDMIGVAAHAWPQPVNGIYPRVDAEPNHAFLLWKPRYFAFDNYTAQDGTFIKQLAPDYDFHSTAYRVYLSKEDPTATQKQVTLYTQLVALLTLLRDTIKARMGL